MTIDDFQTSVRLANGSLTEKEKQRILKGGGGWNGGGGGGGGDEGGGGGGGGWWGNKPKLNAVVINGGETMGMLNELLEACIEGVFFDAGSSAMGGDNFTPSFDKKGSIQIAHTAVGEICAKLNAGRPFGEAKEGLAARQSQVVQLTQRALDDPVFAEWVKEAHRAIPQKSKTMVQRRMNRD